MALSGAAEAERLGGDDVVHDAVHDVLHAADGHAEAEGIAEEASVGGVAGIFLRFMPEIAEAAEVCEGVDVAVVGCEEVTINQAQNRRENPGGRIEGAAEERGAVFGGRYFMLAAEFFGKIVGHGVGEATRPVGPVGWSSDKGKQLIQLRSGSEARAGCDERRENSDEWRPGS